MGGKAKLTNEIFIEKSNKIHNNFYSYDKANYINYKEKVIVTCPIHGDFEITPNKHLLGQGCPKCRYIKSADSKRRSVDEVIRLAKEVHGDKYDYSLIKEYKNDREKLPIICKEHGVFYQTMNNHIKAKQGCSECGKIKCSDSRTYTSDEFINLAKKTHDDFYNYDKVNYINSKTKVTITCPIHGDFEQIPRNHLMGQGCPKCFFTKSNIESEILEFVKTFSQDVIENDRTILEGKEIDILIPSKNIGIEVNGLIWHSEKFDVDAQYHIDKCEKCLNKGIRLIQIYEDEWYSKKNIIKSRLRNLLQCNTEKIYARKCEIKEVSYEESNIFLNENHLQGKSISKYRYGLYYNGELVSLMTFSNLRKVLGSKSKENSYELLRFCNKLNTNVIGGASKLFKYFIKKYDPKEIVSYADRRWSNGLLYEVLGFNLTHKSKPSYYYVVNKKRVNRFSLRKDVLVSKYGCDEKMTEHEFCLSKGWYRIYDCGCLCFKWKK